MQRPRTSHRIGSLFSTPRRRQPAASAATGRPSRGVQAELLEERLLMALAKASGGSGYSGCLSTNPTIRQQQLICDPFEPAAGSTSVSYNADLVTLARLEYGPAYGPRVVVDGEFTNVIPGYVEVRSGDSTFLQEIDDFLREPAGVETGYVQVYFQLGQGDPGQMTPPDTNTIDDIAGVEGTDTHALYFDQRPEIILTSHDTTFLAAAAAPLAVPTYTIFASGGGAHSNNAEDFLLTLEGVRLGPADLSPAFVSTNAGPTITSLTTNAGAVGSLAQGAPVSLTGLFFNPTASDTHKALLDWGDGATTLVNPATSPVSASHSYVTGGVYDVILTVTDDDGQFDTETTRVYIPGANVRDGLLQVVGTGGADRVEVSTKDLNGDGRDDQVRVSGSFLPERLVFDINSVQAVHVRTGAGADKISVWETVPGDSVLEGGDGNDELAGGRRSLLIGGRGSDIVAGANGNDILVGGTTVFDGNTAALLNILGGTLALTPASVIDDGDSDSLNGHRGIDVFYLGALDVILDVYLNRDGPETIFT